MKKLALIIASFAFCAGAFANPVVELGKINDVFEYNWHKAADLARNEPQSATKIKDGDITLYVVVLQASPSDIAATKEIGKLELKENKYSLLVCKTTPKAESYTAKDSPEYALFEKAIAQNCQNIGQTYSVKLLGKNGENYIVDFEYLTKGLGFVVENNLFSANTATAVYSTTYAKFKAKFAKDSLIFIFWEHDIVNKTPFWSDIPLIGGLFNERSTQLSPVEILSVKIANK